MEGKIGRKENLYSDVFCLLAKFHPRVISDKIDARYDCLRFLVGWYKLWATHWNLSTLYIILFVLIKATSLHIVIFQ